MNRHTKSDISIVIIRLLTVSLIVLATVIATINYGFSGRLDPQARQVWHMLYFYFEHLFRACAVFLGSVLTFRLIKERKRQNHFHLKVNLIGFSAAAFFLLVVWPLASGYWELYNILMPFPWSTLPWQLAITGKSFGIALPGWMGIDAATLLIWAYAGYQVIVFAGTAVLGRKWYCSMLCLLNGCHAETLGEALPFLVHNKKRPQSKEINPALRKALIIIQWVLFSVNLVLIGLWTFSLLTGHFPIAENTLLRIEMVKYVSLELTLMMFLWLVIGGRGYCFYCPAGLGLALVSRLAGQRVETGLTRCTQCRACNETCKMSIDIMSMAKSNRPVRDLSCVGCGLCVDRCPTANLGYRTNIFNAQETGRVKSVSRTRLLK